MDTITLRFADNTTIDINAVDINKLSIHKISAEILVSDGKIEMREIAELCQIDIPERTLRRIIYRGNRPDGDTVLLSEFWSVGIVSIGIAGHDIYMPWDQMAEETTNLCQSTHVHDDRSATVRIATDGEMDPMGEGNLLYQDDSVNIDGPDAFIIPDDPDDPDNEDGFADYSGDNYSDDNL